MVRRSLRAGLWLGLLLGMGWALRRAMLLRRVSESVEVSNDPWSPIAQPVAEADPAAAPEAAVPEAAAAPEASTAPAPAAGSEAAAAPEAATAPAPAAGSEAATAPEAAPPSARTWVEPQDGTCPATHPIKVKLASGIYHLPGMLAYDRTKADRCYGIEVDAVADGFVRAKR